MPPEIDGGNTAAPAPILDVEPKNGRGKEDDIVVSAIENLSPIEDADGAAAAAAESCNLHMFPSGGKLRPLMHHCTQDTHTQCC